MIPRNPRRMVDAIVFFFCLAVFVCYIGFEMGAYAERIKKEAACVAIPPIPQRSTYDMGKKQKKLWIKYYKSKGET